MQHRRSVAIACLALAAFGCSDPESDSGKPDETGDVPTEVRGMIDDAVADGFSGSILVTANGERLVTEAHGLADRENDVPNTVDTAFDVGSILKGFTATAIFKLTEDATLTLDETLGEIFPEAPPDKADITLLEVVQHTAGFDEYHDTTGDFEEMTRLEAREAIFAQELLFEPGTDEAYSNSGYTLLADVIETVSGKTYVDYVHDELFTPAGMSQSGFYSEPVWQTVDTAIGYDSDTFGDNDPATWPYTWALVGNGGLVTTVGDLDRWVTALFGGDIVSAETLELMRDEYLAGEEAEIGGQVVYGEAGAGDFGLGGVAVYAPDSNTRVLMASNAYDVFDIETFAVDLTMVLLGGD